MIQTKPNVLIINEFLPDHQSLFKTLQETVEWDTRMAARYTASYGEPYNYSQITYPAAPMHPALESVATALHQTLEIPFNNCLLNFYQTGDSTMGFHSDDTSKLQLGTGVAIISLGNTRNITYRQKNNHNIRHSFALTPGSMLYMDSAVQDDWMHAIKRQKNAGPRISLTWRAFAARIG